MSGPSKPSLVPRTDNQNTSNNSEENNNVNANNEPRNQRAGASDAVPPSATLRPPNWESMMEEEKREFNRQRNIIYLRRSRERRREERLMVERQYQQNEERMDRLEQMVTSLRDELGTERSDHEGGESADPSGRCAHRETRHAPTRGSNESQEGKRKHMEWCSASDMEEGVFHGRK